MTATCKRAIAQGSAGGRRERVAPCNKPALWIAEQGSELTGDRREYGLCGEHLAELRENKIAVSVRPVIVDDDDQAQS